MWLAIFVLFRQLALFLRLAAAIFVGFTTRSLSGAGAFLLIAISGVIALQIAKFLGHIVGAFLAVNQTLFTLTEWVSYFAFIVAALPFVLIAGYLAGFAAAADLVSPLGWAALGLHAVAGLAGKSKSAIRANMRADPAYRAWLRRATGSDTPPEHAAAGPRPCSNYGSMLPEGSTVCPRCGFINAELTTP